MVAAASVFYYVARKDVSVPEPKLTIQSAVELTPKDPNKREPTVDEHMTGVPRVPIPMSPELANMASATSVHSAVSAIAAQPARGILYLL